MNRAVVLGGGLAGVLAATVLARHADEVVVVERDHFPAAPGPRRGLPQSHHSHVLVTGGAEALETLLPGTLQDLYAHGAHRRGLPGDSLILSAEGWFHRFDCAAYFVSCTRGLLDHVVRRRAGVRVAQGVQALGLTGDAGRVTGVRVAGAAAIGADLVVDATGRRSQGPRWLAEIGGPPIEETTVSTGLAYATRICQAPPGLDDLPAIMLHPTPGLPRGATLLPLEDGRWVATLTGTQGSAPPLSEAAFLAFARSLRDPIVAELLAMTTVEGPIRPFRDTANRRRHYERAALPAGFVAIGDAAVAVNPLYSHGMSVAALAALRLDGELTSAEAGPGLQAALVAAAEPSWRMAVARDRHVSGAADEPEPSAHARKVRARLARARLGSAELAAGLFHAQALIPAPPLDDAARFHALTREPAPLLTADQARRQYPALTFDAAIPR
ncbi:NAD(P)/FAD-dependent oxidoreductase [Spongiactinospora rosea]|uniref:NAD(P)/FAD-dependent oxidoreductase n=1 Tax=Spongiactinospora rosea TaxID=2248750 RepID=UPI000DE9E133|nr:FAD-dependent oxidoreductase [Spongiactinospora rosea]